MTPGIQKLKILQGINLVIFLVPVSNLMKKEKNKVQ